MPTKVLFHCEKKHDLTFHIPPHLLGIIVTKKGQTEVPEVFNCKDFDNVGFDTPSCAQCSHCFATEVNDE